jgi:hypothetical protein
MKLRLKVNLKTGEGTLAPGVYTDSDPERPIPEALLNSMDYPNIVEVLEKEPTVKKDAEKEVKKDVEKEVKKAAPASPAPASAAPAGGIRRRNATKA